MGHRTLHVLSQPPSSAQAAAFYYAGTSPLHSTHRARAGPCGRPPDLVRFGIMLVIIDDIGIRRVFWPFQAHVMDRA